MSKVRSPRTMTPQSPRRARGSWRASLHAGQSQKNAGTPHPAPVPMNVNVCCVAISLPAFLRVFRTRLCGPSRTLPSMCLPIGVWGGVLFASDYSKRFRVCPPTPARPIVGERGRGVRCETTREAAPCADRRRKRSYLQGAWRQGRRQGHVAERRGCSDERVGRKGGLTD